jgi:hypothetical protein
LLAWQLPATKIAEFEYVSDLDIADAGQIDIHGGKNKKAPRRRGSQIENNVELVFAATESQGAQ